MKDSAFRTKAKMTGIFTHAIKPVKWKSKTVTLHKLKNADEQAQVVIQQLPTKVVKGRPHSIDSGKSKRAKASTKKNAHWNRR